MSSTDAFGTSELLPSVSNSLDIFASVGSLVGGIAVAISLVFLAYQIRQTRLQMKGVAAQERVTTRTSIWMDQLDKPALWSAHQLLQEKDKRDSDELPQSMDFISTWQAEQLRLALVIEMLYYQNLLYQRAQGLLDKSQSRPLDTLPPLGVGFNRAMWRKLLRRAGGWDSEFIAHADAITDKWEKVAEVPKQDRLQRRKEVFNT